MKTPNQALSDIAYVRESLGAHQRFDSPWTNAPLILGTLFMLIGMPILDFAPHLFARFGVVASILIILSLAVHVGLHGWLRKSRGEVQSRTEKIHNIFFLGFGLGLFAITSLGWTGQLDGKLMVQVVMILVGMNMVYLGGVMALPVTAVAGAALMAWCVGMGYFDTLQFTGVGVIFLISVLPLFLRRPPQPVTDPDATHA